MIQSGQVEEIELLPSERNEIIITWAALQRKYGDRPATSLVLMEFVNEGVDRFRELGFEVHIDPTVLEPTEGGDVVVSPEITLLRRVSPEISHDHEQHSFETVHGYEDGVEGAMGPKGEFLDPKPVM